MGDGRGGPLPDVAVGIGNPVDGFITIEVVRVVSGGGGGTPVVPSTQYDLPATRFEQSVTSGFHVRNCSSVISQIPARV
jgi:hypothetical protein